MSKAEEIAGDIDEFNGKQCVVKGVWSQARIPSPDCQ